MSSSNLILLLLDSRFVSVSHPSQSSRLLLTSEGLLCNSSDHFFWC